MIHKNKGGETRVKIRNVMILLTLVYSLIHFSPHVVNAADDVSNEVETDNIEKVEESVEDSIDEPELEDQESGESSEDESAKEEEDKDKDKNPLDESVTDQKVDDLEEDKKTKSTKSMQSDPTIFEEGMRHEKIVEIKKQLNKLGFSGIKTTNYFGEFTTKRVKEFQTYYGLQVDGKVAKGTLDKLNEVTNHPLQKGKVHNDLINLKQKLNKIGYNGIAISPTFGAFTEKQVKAFQKDHNLPQSGIIEEITEEEINSVFSAMYQEGADNASVSELKKNLNRLGFGGLSTSGVYGSHTTKRVKEFQQYYGLKATGNADSETLEKVNEIVTHPLQNGKKHDDLVGLKQMLNRIGYSGIAVSPTFGAFTEKQVKAFQKDHNLPQSGIIEENTEEKINSVFSTMYQEGADNAGVSELKKNLNRLGFGGLSTSGVYGSHTTKRVKEFQQYYGLKATGNADFETLEKVKEIVTHPLQNGKKHNDLVELKQKLNRIGYSGIAASPTFGPFTEKQVKAFQKDYKLPQSGIIEENTEEEINSVFSTMHQEGADNENISELKKNLNRLGFGGLSTSGVYGPHTTKRVKEFQQYYGLEATGNADLETFKQVNEIVTHPLQDGKKHSDLVELKQKLNRIGYSGIAATRTFGPFTEKQVKAFQKDYNLPQSGIIEENTESKINSVFSTMHQEGADNENISELKKNLNRLGFGGLSTSGVYGSHTTKRVKEFQQYYGLDATGNADLETLKKVNEIVSHPLQKGKKHNDLGVLKQKLNRIGYSGIAVSPTFGTFTEKQVKAIQ